MGKISKWRKTTTVLILCTCLIWSAAQPFMSSANTKESTPPASTEFQAVESQLSTFLNEKIDTQDAVAIHDMEEFGDNEVALELNDGTISVYCFSEPIKYEDENGETKFKDITIVKQNDPAVIREGFEYTNGDNDFSIDFSEDVDTGVKISSENGEVSLVPVQSEELDKLDGEVKEIVNTDNNTENVFSYEGVFGEGSCIEYSPQLNGLKENIILDQYTGQNTFDFVLNAHGNIAELVDGQIVEIKDRETGEVVNTLLPLFAYDSYDDGEYSTDPAHYTENCVYTLKEQEGGTYKLTVVVSEEWLTAPTTVYPVTIDPTITENYTGMDCALYSAKPDDVFSTGYFTNNTGFSSTYGKGRAMFKFAMPTAIPTGAVIVGAKYYFRETTAKSDATYVGAHMINSVANGWTSSIATWNKYYNACDEQLDRRNINSTSTDVSGSPYWYKFNIVKAVQKWINGTNANRGIMLVSESEGTTASWRAWASIRHGTSSYKPYANIMYEPDNYTPDIFSIDGNPSTWTNKDVVLSVNGVDYDSGIKDYSFDGGTTWQAGKTKTYSANTSGIKIWVRDYANNIWKEPSINITKIDKIIPVINSVTKSPSTLTNGSVTLTVNATDTLSGIASTKGYSFDNGTTWQDGKTKLYTVNTSNIKIMVKDNVGNKSAVTTENITNIDKTAPSTPEVTLSPEEWTNGSVRLTVTATGIATTNGYSFDNGATWQTPNYKDYNENTSGIKVKTKDAAGNPSAATLVDITNIDKLAPNPVKGVNVEFDSDNDDVIVEFPATTDLPATGNSGVKEYNIYWKTPDSKTILMDTVAKTNASNYSLEFSKSDFSGMTGTPNLVVESTDNAVNMTSNFVTLGTNPAVITISKPTNWSPNLPENQTITIAGSYRNCSYIHIYVKKNNGDLVYKYGTGNSSPSNSGTFSYNLSVEERTKYRIEIVPFLFNPVDLTRSRMSDNIVSKTLTIYPAKTIDVSGRFIVKIPSGYNSNYTISKSLANAKVKIWGENANGSTHLGTVMTNSSGNYSCKVYNDTTTPNSGYKIKVEVLLDNNIVRVAPNFSPHSWTSGTIARNPPHKAALGTLYPTTKKQDFEQASNIFLEVNKGHAFIKSKVNKSMPKVNVIYYAGHNVHSNMLIDTIRLSGKSDNSDSLDNSVIMHEYGHFVMHQLGVMPFYNVPVHTFWSPSNKACAWSEGWATFFGQSVYSKKNFADLYKNGYYLQFDMENENFKLQSNYSKNQEVEGNINLALWDLLDSNQDTMKPTSDVDRISNSFATIYNIMKSKKHSSFQSFYDEFMKNTSSKVDAWKVFHSRALSFDTTLPQIGTMKYSSDKISATATDNVGVATYQWVLDGKAQTKKSGSTISPYTVPTGIGGGWHTVTLRVWDYEGNASLLSGVNNRVRNTTYASKSYSWYVPELVLTPLELQTELFDLDPNGLALKSNAARVAALNDISDHDVALTMETFDVVDGAYTQEFTVDKNNIDINIYSVIDGPMERVKVYDPNGNLFADETCIFEDTPITITSAQPGEWQVEYTPLEDAAYMPHITSAVLASPVAPENLDSEYYTKTKAVDLNTELELDPGQTICITDHESGEELYNGSSDSFVLSALTPGENEVDVQVVDDVFGETMISDPQEVMIKYDNVAPKLTFDSTLHNLEEAATNYATEEYSGIDETVDPDDIILPDYEIEDSDETIVIDEPDPDQKFEFLDPSGITYSEEYDVFNLGGIISEYADVWINGEAVEVKLLEDGTVEYGLEMHLPHGSNLITIKAVDRSGNETIRTFTVNY